MTYHSLLFPQPASFCSYISQDAFVQLLLMCLCYVSVHYWSTEVDVTSKVKGSTDAQWLELSMLQPKCQSILDQNTELQTAPDVSSVYEGEWMVKATGWADGLC